MKKILLVEDDQNLSFMIKDNLEDLGFEVCHILKGEDAFQMLENEHIDLILMDIELPGELDGFETAEAIREKYPVLPIIFATARTTGKDIERGFSFEYMDYVKKPFGVKEIALRIDTLLGSEKPGDAMVMIGSFTFDPRHHRLLGYGKEFQLTNLESRFLAILYKNVGSMVRKELLIQILWGEVNDSKSKEKSLYNLVYKLRQCFKEEALVEFETISKQGYRIMVKEAE